MTKGHFHPESDRTEFWGIQGKGMLILLERERNLGRKVYQRSLHYIGGHIAHRLSNTGSEKLIIGAFRSSDAGHDYNEIAKNGFSARMVEQNGDSILI